MGTAQKLKIVYKCRDHHPTPHFIESTTLKTIVVKKTYFNVISIDQQRKNQIRGKRLPEIRAKTWPELLSLVSVSGIKNFGRTVFWCTFYRVDDSGTMKITIWQRCTRKYPNQIFINFHFQKNSTRISIVQQISARIFSSNWNRLEFFLVNELGSGRAVNVLTMVDPLTFKPDSFKLQMVVPIVKLRLDHFEDSVA